MDSKKWSALLTAVEAGSFTHAADTLGYTQSGLTHMMNSLEKESGIALLTRGHYGVKLTPEAEKLLPAVRKFTQAAARLEREIAVVREAKAETIRIGAYASVAVHWLPPIVQQFRMDHPGVQVDIHLANGAQQLRSMLLGDQVDLGIGGRPKNLSSPQFNWLHLKDDPLLAVLPPDYPLNGRTVLPLWEFTNKEFLVSSQGFDPAILEVMEERGIRPDIRPSAMDDLTVITLVAHGLGVSMLTELVLEGTSENVLTLPVAPAASRELGILTLTSREYSSTLRKFIRYTVDTIQGFQNTEPSK